MIGDTLDDPGDQGVGGRDHRLLPRAGLLAWLEHGDPARDEEFIAKTTAGLVALYTSFVDEA
ncbi:MAG: hypothetical protein U5R31_02365 [Acidimicrobiia bacterium]|nr:hypothetical protein [Acidimicrobiia bacterium]